ncbi:hypothetical protein EV179_002298 [Coemansia sp. RSA 487]|nr:hypothetical protein EV179_002298 [Coemansia sp. RSA 487]
MDHSDSPTKVEANELTTPFPALEYLKLYPGRIFDDYALFQRCSNTLINLDIELDRKTVDILEKTNVFSGAKNSQLCHITLRIAFDSRITMSAVEFVKFAVGLSTPATRTLAINGDIPYQSIIRVIPTCPYAEKLQILDLREVNLSLSEMISGDFGGIYRELCSGIDSGLYGEYAETIKKLFYIGV